MVIHLSLSPAIFYKRANGYWTFGLKTFDVIEDGLFQGLVQNMVNNIFD